MAEVVYTVRVVLDETKQDETRKKATQPTPKEREEVKDAGAVAAERFGRVMAAYGTYKVGANYYQTRQFAENTFKGDGLAAIKERQKAQLRENIISSGLRITGGFIVKGAAGGGIMIALTALQLAQKAINIGLENNMRQKEIQAEKYLSSIQQERFVRNSTTERIKW